MKNKEIKEMIQDRIEDIYQSGEYIYQAKELEEILSYIEQLEKENEFLKLDNPNANIKHFEMLKENKRKIDNLRYQNKQLENNRDKVIRTLETLKGSARWERHLYEVDYILDILKGGSDE